MSNNAYNTRDPEKLLRLKRLEAEALRDVIRAFKQYHQKPSSIFKITQNVLLAQLGVGRMMFLYRNAEGLQTGISRGFSSLTETALRMLPGEAGVMRTSETILPEFFSAGVENIITLNFQDKPAAWFLVGDFAESEAERENDLIFIETLGHVLTAVLENQFLVGEMLRQESIRSQLEVAERIQRQLLPSDFQEIRGAEVAAFNEPHHRVGGDYYDIIGRGEKGFFVCIADVSGKGIGAALLMANLQAQLRSLILSENDLASIISKLNRQLLGITGGDQFVTLFLAHVMLAEKKIEFINAGHHHPVFISKQGFHFLSDGTIPLGLMEPIPIKQGSVHFEYDDRLFLYTDGLPDQHNLKDDKLGEDRVREILAAWKQESPAELLAGMIEEWKEFSKGTTAADDVTLLAITFRP